MSNVNTSVEDEEQEINIGQACLAVLKKWRVALVLMVVFGILLGCYKGITEFITVKNDTDGDVASAISTYNTLVENNKEARKEIRDAMSRDNDQISEQSEYLADSVLMNIDPYAVHIASASYYVKTDYEIMPDMTYQNINYTDSVVSAYASMITNPDYLNKIVDATGIKLRYLNEIVSVWNGGNGLLYLQVESDSDETSADILGMLISYIDEVSPIITETIDEHTITKMTYTIYTTVDTGLESTQNAEKDELSALRTKLSDDQETYDELEEAFDDIEDPGYTTESIIKDAIKFAIIGIVVGLVIAFVIYILGYIMGDGLYSGQELSERLKLTDLADVATSDKKLLKFDAYIRRKQCRPFYADRDSALALAVNRIKGIDGEIKTVLVTGEADEKLAQETVKKLNELAAKAAGSKAANGNGKADEVALKFTYAGSFLTAPEAVSAAEGADAVLLIEQVKVSKYSRIRKEIAIATEIGKKVIGAVVLD